MKLRLLYLPFILALFVPIVSIVFPPAQAAADVSGTGVNILRELGENCHDLQDITHDFGFATNGGDEKSACHEPQGVVTQGGLGWEEVLNTALNCSSDMFYQHPFTDPNDSSVTTKTLWYTHLGNYKDCYNKAQTMFNNMTNTGSSGQCVLAAEGSQNYKNCLADVDNLHAALGCSINMLQKTNKKDSQGDYYYTVDPNSGAAQDCKQRITDVGNVQIVIFDGSGNTTKSPPISDPSVTPGSSDGGGNSSAGSVPTLSCNVSFNPLTWVICPAVQGMVSIIGDLDNAINSQLSVGSPGNSDDPNQIFCDKNTASDNGGQQAVNNCEAYYSAWSSFRDIALGLLAVVGLAIIISEMSGLEFFDAYTVRKVLPRLIFAAIAITLSWQLMQFFVTLTNDLGYGIRWLIYQPFVKAGIDSATLSGGAVTAVGLATGSAIIALSIFGLLSFAATAALAVFLAFLTLIIRQLLIIILVIIAPVAIIAYVLPNTQGVYKLWWGTFSKALLMFPIIAAFIAAGRVFAAISDNSSSGILGQLMGFAAYFAPYFLIPMTFRFAGGAISAIGGFVNDRGRGAFDRLGSYRKNKFDTNMRDLAAGNRYKASNPVASAFNRTTRGIANVPSAGVTPWKMRSRFQAGMSQHEMTAMNEYMENSQAWKAVAGNDDYLQATMKNMGGGDTEDDWRRYLSGQGYSGRSLEAGVAAIRAAKRDTNDEVFKSAAVVANASTGTGWKEGGAGAMMESINEAAGGDRAKAARMLADMRGRAQQARRIDLSGAGFGGQVTDLEAMNNGTMTADEATARNNSKVLELNGAGAIAGARGDSMKLLAPAMKEELLRAHASGNETTIKRTWAKAANIYDTVAHASPENAELFADQVLAQPFDGSTVKVDRRNARGELIPQLDASGKTIPVLDNAGNDTGRIHYQQEEIPLTGRRVLERFRNDDEFLNMRRELSSQEQFAQQQSGGAELGGTGAGGGLGGPTVL
ncbi:MAG TPA: hypothetical protein VHB72_00240 [Candidatus Saccharimonadales bacterium]|nr:hypothetical protein [Candidatus Saccharimonadales bacterium]